jgi:tetratricopeptide (TPR) repeat protein
MSAISVEPTLDSATLVPEPERAVPARKSKTHLALAAALIALLAFAIFRQVGGFAFLNFDDDLYLENNPWMRKGITAESLRWAFTANLTEFSIRAEYWSPVTLLTRLADAEIWGMNAGGYHIASAVLHALNALLLFLAVRALTRSSGRSLVVALLFLAHPLAVEPACWLSARKDLVSGGCFFLTLVAYAWFAHRPSWRRYVVAIGAFFLGCMAKPMVVSIPFVLLLLDLWPLRRWSFGNGWRALQPLLIEKVPFVILSAAVAGLAIISQRDWGAMQDAGSLPFLLRLENAVLSYGTYLRRVFWPSDLGIYYPHPGATISLAAVIVSAVVLAALTVLAWRLRERRPEVLVGWLWFGIVLGPVIGLIQIGNQAMADRYMYPAMAGVLIPLVWGCADLLRKRQRLATAVAAAAILLSAAVSIRQVSYWRDSEAAFTRALAVTEKNDVAHLNLGSAYFVKGNLPAAREHFRQSLTLQPLQKNGWNNLGAVEAALGHDQEAIAAYQVAIRVNPKSAKTAFHLGRLLLKRGDARNAEALIRRAGELEPGWPEPYAELGRLYAEQQRNQEAAAMLTTYLKLRPADQPARDLLARVAAP